MDRTTLAGRETSRIGFGCGRLSGGGGTKASLHLIEQVRGLGITHFDVAPSYGLGLAEDVLGEALAGDGGATIATKAGIGRPGNAGLKSLARQVLRPLLSATPALRRALGAKAGGAPRGQFAPEQIEASVAESLRRLRRDRIDALLLHEPMADAITPALSATMESFVARDLAGAVGSGTGRDREALATFGTVRQYRWSPGNAPGAKGTDIVHGLLRRYPRPQAPSVAWSEGMLALGFDPADPAAWPALVLTFALAALPGAILLVSSTDAARIAAPLRAIDWNAARGAKAGFAEAARVLLSPPD